MRTILQTVGDRCWIFRKSLTVFLYKTDWLKIKRIVSTFSPIRSLYFRWILSFEKFIDKRSSRARGTNSIDDAVCVFGKLSIHRRVPAPLRKFWLRSTESSWTVTTDRHCPHHEDRSQNHSPTPRARIVPRKGWEVYKAWNIPFPALNSFPSSARTLWTRVFCNGKKLISNQPKTK